MFFDRRARSRAQTNMVARWIFTICGAMSVVLIAGIFLILFWNALFAFTMDNPVGTLTDAEKTYLGREDTAKLEALSGERAGFFDDFLFKSTWKPTAIKKKPQYGILAMVVSTLLTTFGALLIAIPLGIGTAAWLSLRAPPRLQHSVKFAVEMLAAVPSVVVGFIGIVFVGPLITWAFDAPGLNALNGCILLAVMALPTIVSISEDAFSSVPRELVDGSLALGADRFQTLVRLVAPAARSGLFAAVMLGMGRAIGETMTVLMVCGNAVAMPTGLFDPVRTMTATIAIELGEVPQGTIHYHMLFAIGFLLFLITFAVNLAAGWFQRKSRRMMG
jgi:phosphate transport system permease protein